MKKIINFIKRKIENNVLIKAITVLIILIIIDYIIKILK